jgi:hypothetical protein
VTRDIAYEMHAGLLKMVAAAASPITLCWEMSGQKERRQPELFVVVSRCEFLSDDHNFGPCRSSTGSTLAGEDVSALYDADKVGLASIRKLQCA